VARYRWVGSGESAALFALSEAGGTLRDLGTLAVPDPEAVCRAELRVEGPGGAWAARFASLVYDEPSGLFWDGAGLLLVAYGLHLWALDARSGELRWSRRSGSPLLAVLGSSRLDHVLLQSEIETVALRSDGSVAWRIAHGEVLVGAELVGGRLVLTTYRGQHLAFDPATGRSTQ